MKKLIIIWLILVMLFSSTALAAESVDESGKDNEEIITELMMVEPRYTYLGYMTIGLDIDENGYLIYGGSACAPYYDLQVTIYLQRSTNGLFWEDLAGTVKTGYDTVQIEEERSLSEDDYFYRAKIVTKVLDSKNNVLETATGYSSEERY